MIYFGKRLKSLRKKAGLTQKQLADRIGISKSIISCYELQERYPSAEYLIKLAKIFNVSTDYLLGLENRIKEDLDLTELKEEDIELLKRIIQYMKQKNKEVH